MNSLLQCLFNIPKLRNDFIEGLKEKTFKKKSTPICYYFAKVMKELLYSDEEYITPYKFKKYISKKNNLFKDHKAADATDLFRNLIDSFLDEIEYIFPNSQGGIEEGVTPEGEITKRTLFKGIKKEIKNNFIYSILNVYNIVTYYCPFHKRNEDNITYSIESDSNITFYLANIMENRKKNINSPITLKECFEYIQQEKKNNEFYCSKCEKVVKGNSQEKIFYPPEILIIILNRGHGKTFKGKVIIDKRIDISDFIDGDGKNFIEYDDKKTYYRLIASCNHSGESSPTGHYTATCYNEEKDSYYYYNDTFVKKVNSFICVGESYMLFYKLTKMSDYNDPSEDIRTETSNNLMNEDSMLYNNNKNIKTLSKVYEIIKNNNNENYSINKYNNDIQ